MNEKNVFQDARYLRERQYKDSKNLSARAALHQRFSTADTPFHPWVFAQIGLQPGESVLECGCGPGWLWRQNVDRIPAHCSITLTDLSFGMVAEAKTALPNDNGSYRFGAASILKLPYPAASFDIVVANHMLYHVPDIPAALREVVRVLRPNGRFYAATNGANHMREVAELGTTLFPDAVAELQQSRLQRSAGMSLPFRRENGRDILAPFFKQIDVIAYPDSLHVTEAAPLVAYALSTLDDPASVSDTTRRQLRAAISRRIEAAGPIHITKSTVLFVCRP